MSVGVLGSGSVVQALGSGFLRHGAEVMLGARDVTKLEEWSRREDGARTGSFADAAAFGEVVVLAVRGAVAEQALQAAGAEHLAGKPVIDATNPLDGRDRHTRPVRLGRGGSRRRPGGRVIEPLLWCIPGILHGRWDHAFKLIRAGGS